MMLWPSRKQWTQWTLPSRLTAIGVGLTVAGIILSIVMFAAARFDDRAVPDITNVELRNSIDQIATKLGRIEEIVGIYHNERSGIVVLIGKDSFQQVPIPLTLEDIALSLRLAELSIDNSIKSTPIGCSFEESHDGYLQVRFYGGIENTHLGYVLYGADLALKEYSTGVRAGGEVIQTSVELFGDILDRFKPSEHVATAGRLWLSSTPVLYSSDTLATVKETGVVVRAEEVIWNNEADIVAHNTEGVLHSLAHVFADNFETISKEERRFAAFTRIVQLLAVSKWLTRSAAIDTIEWLDEYADGDNTKTPIRIPQVVIEQEQVGDTKLGFSISSVFRIHGGISLRLDSMEVMPAKDLLSRQVGAIMSKGETTLLLGTGSSFEFQALGNYYIGIVLHGE